MQFLLALDIIPVVLSQLDDSAIFRFSAQSVSAVVWLGDGPRGELVRDGAAVVVLPESLQLIVADADPKLIKLQ